MCCGIINFFRQTIGKATHLQTIFSVQTNLSPNYWRRWTITYSSQNRSRHYSFSMGYFLFTKMWLEKCSFCHVIMTLFYKSVTKQTRLETFRFGGSPRYNEVLMGPPNYWKFLISYLMFVNAFQAIMSFSLLFYLHSFTTSSY